jgi:hypothetical protein
MLLKGATVHANLANECAFSLRIAGEGAEELEFIASSADDRTEWLTVLQRLADGFSPSGDSHMVHLCAETTNPYKVLGVKSTATFAVITRAFQTRLAELENRGAGRALIAELRKSYALVRCPESRARGAPLAELEMVPGVPATAASSKRSLGEQPSVHTRQTSALTQKSAGKAKLLHAARSPLSEDFSALAGESSSAVPQQQQAPRAKKPKKTQRHRDPSIFGADRAQLDTLKPNKHDPKRRDMHAIRNGHKILVLNV